MKSTPPPLVVAAARVLVRDAEIARSVPEDARGRAVLAMKMAMRARARRRRFTWLATAGAGALVAAAVVLAVTSRQHAVNHTASTRGVATEPANDGAAGRAATVVGDVEVRHGETSSALLADRRLTRGDRVVTAEASSTAVTLLRGTRVDVAPNSEVVMDSEGKVFAFDLVGGSIEASVSKLLPGERFLVRTTDAEIEVHGTAFRVTREPASKQCASPATLLTVTEGVVSARTGGVETFVHPGETWRSTACRHERADARPAQVEPSSTTTSIASPLASAPAAKSTSNLAKQNDLFAMALAHKASGDTDTAIRIFEDLLARYPESHLAQSASVERMKLLHTKDPSRGRAAASEYLNRYPTGFARHDAERILSTD